MSLEEFYQKNNSTCREVLERYDSREIFVGPMNRVAPGREVTFTLPNKIYFALCQVASDLKIDDIMLEIGGQIVYKQCRCVNIDNKVSILFHNTLFIDDSKCARLHVYFSDDASTIENPKAFLILLYQGLYFTHERSNFHCLLPRSEQKLKLHFNGVGDKINLHIKPNYPLPQKYFDTFELCIEHQNVVHVLSSIDFDTYHARIKNYFEFSPVNFGALEFDQCYIRIKNLQVDVDFEAILSSIQLLE